MPAITCPNCLHDVPFTVKLSAPTAPKRPTDATPLTASALRAVLEFMEERPGRHTVGDLFANYSSTRETYNGPKLTKQAFVMALRRNGATRWRTGTSRGYEIPEIEPTQRPAKVAPTTQEKVNRDAYAQAVVDHSSEPAQRPRTPFRDLSELPFEIEG